MKLIVTLTSFKGRIHLVENTIISILNNVKSPDKIVLNLSSDEFPQKENELPESLITLSGRCDFEIYWVKENVKQFKKLIPTLLRYPNDIIISIDDDIIYSKDFISTLFSDFMKNRFQHPITIWKNTPYTNNIYGNLHSHCGRGTITMSKFYLPLLNDIYKNFVFDKINNNEKIFDDPLYTYCALLNGYSYKECSRSYNDLILREIRTNIAISKDNGITLKNWHDTLLTYISSNYSSNFTKGKGFNKTLKKDSVTFIIPNRGGKEILRVIDNFSKTFQRYFLHINFIVVEQKDNKIFMKGQLYNIAMKYATSEFIVLIDNDIYNLDSFDVVSKYRELNGAFLGFDEITQISFIKDNNFKVIKSEKRLGGYGAFQVMKKSDFISANGFSNLCFGWGAEDDIFNYRIKFKRYKHKLGHISHPRRVNENPQSTKNNRQILDKHKNNTIKKEFDGCKQTTYDVISEKQTGNILYLGVTNIGVTSDFKYLQEYYNACKIANVKPIVNGNNTQVQIKNTNQESQPQTLKKKLTISLTSFRPRISNLTVVLPSLVNQTHKADRIVVNLSPCEFPNKEKDLPKGVMDYIVSQGNLIEINWVDGPDTHMWRKFIPTLLKYRDDLVLGVDDDYIYPSDMVEEFCKTHIEHPDAPISGNRLKMYGLNCHCGSASLVQYKHFQGYIENIPQEILDTVASQDLFYTYIASRNNYTYVQTQQQFFTNLQQYNSVEPFKKEFDCTTEESWNRLTGYYEWPKKREPIIKITNDTQHVTFEPMNERKKNEYADRVKTVLNQIHGPKNTKPTFKGIVKKSSKMYSKSKFI